MSDNAPAAQPVVGLGARMPPPGCTNDDILLAFLDWVADKGLELYPAQEEAVLEVMAGRHVILATPTGSGKTLVATAAHFRALCRGEVSFYTSPIKALVSEKFFDLCREFGSENVGMLTGDASIHRQAPIVCCTAEILSNMSLQPSDDAPIDCVVMDEFHYYADRDRGMAWQVPLLTLPKTTFLLMSATLGDTTAIEQSLFERTGRKVSCVTSTLRPVPLEFEYRETPIHETVADLMKHGRAPVYLVHFSQADAAESAQNLMSVDVCSKDEKRAIAAALHGEKWASPYGRQVERFVRHGIGLHHAGLLPRYRLLVEKLAQQGLLKVICGTDTLGVGINIPLRTVLFSKLCKFDGENTRILSVREFQQVSGRAGRKGFDDKGWVVVQAPEHVIENRRAEGKAGAGKKNFVKKKPPDFGYAHWTKETFEKLVAGRAEALESVFKVELGMLMTLLRRDEPRRGGGLRVLCELIGQSHERPAVQQRLRRDLARLFRALRKAGLVEVVARVGEPGCDVFAAEGLQKDFSLHHTLSLYLVDAVPKLDAQLETHALDVLTVVEAILENPRPILQRQTSKEKGKLVAALKADGVPYDERMELLEGVTWPKPNAEWIYDTFNAFTERHPWLENEAIRPKAIAREMVDFYVSFDDYVREYDLEPMEGLLLRYLTQAYKTLVQNVPDEYKSEAVFDAAGFLRAVLARVDSSLVEEWERLGGERITRLEDLQAPPKPVDIAKDRKVFQARLRAEIHRLVKALSLGEYDEAALSVRQADDDPWPPERFAETLRPFHDAHGRLVFDHAARLGSQTVLRETGFRVWELTQTLRSDEGETGWFVDAEIDLTQPLPHGHDGPVIRVTAVGER
ncbi:MAG: DEAD/DEAH box helicase [Myxococcota bacterium]